MSIRKEQESDDVARRYPGDPLYWSMTSSESLRRLTMVCGARVTTVLPRQGQYAHDPNLSKTYLLADVNLDRIGDVLHYDLPQLVCASTVSHDCLVAQKRTEWRLHAMLSMVASHVRNAG